MQEGRRLPAICALIGAAIIAAGPAGARDATTVPRRPSIEDPVGDANYLNDQEQAGVPDVDDHVTGQDLSSAGDIVKVWFTHSARKVTAFIQTEAPPPAATGLYYRVEASPGEGKAASSPTGCLRWEVLIAGEEQGQQTTFQGPAQAKLIDDCNDISGDGVWAELRAVETLEDGSGLIAVTVPRRYSPLLRDCRVLSDPRAVSKDLVGQDDTVSLGWTTGATIDTTKAGTAYPLDPDKGCS